MNRRGFLQALLGLIPASVALKLGLGDVPATPTVPESDDVASWDNVPFYQNGGRVNSTDRYNDWMQNSDYFASSSLIYRPSTTVAGEWDVIDLSRDE